MHRRTLRAVLTGACAVTLLLAPATAAVAGDCPPPPDCSTPGGAPHCEPTPYTAAVIESQPSWYWRLGEDYDWALDWLTGVGTTLDLGSQVERRVPGAIACDENAAVNLSGATLDGSGRAI
ncbi:hypothetical protein [Conexibacter woesei]|uniref:hypothetical protein n=1 Tax=Conexibacter woesei TaxID=191495 RepID=UPI0005A0B23C|nr:hypothetical protein [Conexibacter woesei]